MTRALQMLETYPGSFDVDATRLAATIDELIECANTCTLCADACLSEDMLGELAKCIRLNLDCSDVCLATGRVISRQTENDANVTRALLNVCIVACTTCADECERHGETMPHCRTCAGACRRCTDACGQLLAAMT